MLITKIDHITVALPQILMAGFILDITLGTNKSGPYTQVLFICRFSNMESIRLETCQMW